MLKGDLVNRAFAQIGVSGITSPADPDDVIGALLIMEDMINEWEGQGITLGYALEENPDPGTESNLPDWATSPVYTNLALRLIPVFELTVNPFLERQASAGIKLVTARTTAVNEIIYPRRMPRGSGNTIRYRIRNRFYREGNQGDCDC